MTLIDALEYLDLEGKKKKHALKPMQGISGQYSNNAPINLMPHYHRYILRWGKMRICIPDNYNSPHTGEVLVIQAPHSYPPTNLLVVKPGVNGDWRGFA